MKRSSQEAPATDDRGFWARWSRRKIDAKAGQADASQAERPTEPVPAEERPAPAAAPALPDIGALDETSDFTIFMSRAVPDAIRNRALRRLWQLDPALANLDGMNDYDEDFTQAGRAIEQVKTAYRVGRGMMSKTSQDDPAPARADAEPADREAEPDQPPAREQT